MARRERITTINISPYEIAKANDINYGFQSIIENIALITNLAVQSERDFIIGGGIEPGQGLNVIVKPFIAFCKDTGMLYCKSVNTKVEFYKSSSINDRIDVITVSGEGWDVFQKERRAKWYVTQNAPTGNEDNDSLVFGEFDKRQSPKIEIEAIQGMDNSELAKNTGPGQIKIAEVRIKAGREILDNSDVHFVSAMLDGEQNKEWTSEKSSTFYIVPIVQTLQRFFKIHNPDGSLKDNVVNKNNLNLSLGDAITSNDLAIGEKIEKRAEELNAATGQYSPVVPIAGNKKLEFKILESTKLKKVFDIVVDSLIYIWKTFIESDKHVLSLSKKYTDNETTELNQEFTNKLNTEIEERKEADREEAHLREEADNIEREERIEAIKTEKEAREAADNIEREERIEGDRANAELAKKAISLSAPVGSAFLLYDEKKHKTFLKADGSTFEPDKYPEFYVYWKENLAFFGTDETGKPYLPLIEKYDESSLGEIAFFIGSEYHHGFLEANGRPFSPYVYEEFYEKYWKKYYSGLGKDIETGWPLRPKIENTSGIAKTKVYIRVLPQEKNEFTYPFIKTGEEI
ncbi:hypothetical protein [Treponema putidum]|uniref:hypothetical protein n=1 Tax=Treponema putidum TaxID=221027 RepID=UPI00210506CE|nr:hypothetical protein [Treponema putidum]UTY31738.1 hypothetical protein E4N75_09765 [Treponema putidum]